MVQKFLLKGKLVRFIPESRTVEFYSDFGFKPLTTSNPNSVGGKILEDFEVGISRKKLLIINDLQVLDDKLYALLHEAIEKFGVQSQMINAASIYKDKFFINDKCIGCSLCDDVVSELTRRLA